MSPLLTTITPVWQRPESLQVWIKALKAATQWGVHHIVFFVGERIPDWWEQEKCEQHNIWGIPVPEPPGNSIGYYHNKGAEIADSEWIMKLDVDAIPNTRYFSELRRMIEQANPREWFNCGMLFMSRGASGAHLDLNRMPLTPEAYTRIMLNARGMAQGSYAKPEASNFCCRRVEYLALGGSDPRFKNWGWEDYQQIYMLEKHWRGCDPLPGLVDISNVTQRCRDEIGRPKANELYLRNRWLCLLHRWHPPSPTPGYKSSEQSHQNRKLVLEHILKAKQNG